MGLLPFRVTKWIWVHVAEGPVLVERMGRFQVASLIIDGLRPFREEPVGEGKHFTFAVILTPLAP
jgi:hypothetical protein